MVKTDGKLLKAAAAAFCCADDILRGRPLIRVGVLSFSVADYSKLLEFTGNPHTLIGRNSLRPTNRGTPRGLNPPSSYPEIYIITSFISYLNVPLSQHIR